MIKSMKYRYVNDKSIILKAMRMSQGFSTREAEKVTKVSKSSITHFETGRMNMPEERIKKMVLAYGYRWREFREFLLGRRLPLKIDMECLKIIEGMSEMNLRKAYMLLSIVEDISFAEEGI